MWNGPSGSRTEVTSSNRFFIFMSCSLTAWMCHSTTSHFEKDRHSIQEVSTATCVNCSGSTTTKKWATQTFTIPTVVWTAKTKQVGCSESQWWCQISLWHHASAETDSSALQPLSVKLSGSTATSDTCSCLIRVKLGVTSALRVTFRVGNFKMSNMCFIKSCNRQNP